MTPWTIPCQASLSIGFTRQEYWNGLPFPPPEGLPDPGIEPTSPVSLALAGGFFTTEPPRDQQSISRRMNETLWPQMPVHSPGTLSQGLPALVYSFIHSCSKYLASTNILPGIRGLFLPTSLSPRIKYQFLSLLRVRIWRVC